MEAIIVLVIVIGLIALGASKSEMLSGNSEATEEISNIQALVTSTRALKSNAGYGASGTDLAATLIAIGGVPTNVAIVGGVLQNPVGGTYVVTSTGAGFTIATSNLKPTLCVKVVPKLTRSGTFSNTKVGSGAATTGEIAAPAATTACGAAMSTVTYTVAS